MQPLTQCLPVQKLNTSICPNFFHDFAQNTLHMNLGDEYL